MEIREVTYYKIIQPIKFTDGFEVKAGQKVMLIQEDTSAGMYNVQMEDNKSKRIFWVNTSNVKLLSVKKERWPKAKVLQHELDINEKWLENESRNTRTANPAGTSSKPKSSKGNNSTTTPGGRTVQKRTSTKGTKSGVKKVADKKPRKTAGKKAVKGTARKRTKKT
jgi:hypothetical protein